MVTPPAAVTIFICGRRERERGVPVVQCEFALGGRKKGQVCGREACHKHQAKVGALSLCPAHSRLSARRV